MDKIQLEDIINRVLEKQLPLIIGPILDVKNAELKAQIVDALADKVTAMIMLRNGTDQIVNVQKNSKNTGLSGAGNVNSLIQLAIPLKNITNSKLFISAIIKQSTSDNGTGAVFYNSILTALNLDKSPDELFVNLPTDKPKNTQRVNKFNIIYDKYIIINQEIKKEMDDLYEQYKKNSTIQVHIIPSTFYLGCTAKMMEIYEEHKKDGVVFDKNELFTGPSVVYEEDNIQMPNPLTKQMQTIPAMNTMSTILVIPAMNTVPTIPAMNTTSTMPTIPAMNIQPSIPAMNTTSTMPTIPAMNIQPSIPAMNTAPALPNIPAMNTQPSIPAMNTLPNIPAINTAPTMPTIPAMNTQPSIPAMNTLPNIPAINTQPSIPAMNTLPNIPAINTQPSIPAMNTMPLLSNIPRMPNIPIPTLPNVPTASSMLSASAASSIPGQAPTINYMVNEALKNGIINAP
jgi:hypothetical protein